MIWPTWWNYLRPRTTVCSTCIPRTSETPQCYQQTIDSLSPTDRQSNRTSQEIEAYLSIFCSSFPEEWAKKLFLVEFTHNNRRHAERRHSPFELMHGESPKTLRITFEKTKYLMIEERMHTLIWDREEALAAHKLAMRRIADRQKNMFIPFKKGDLIWLDTWNIKTTNNPKIGPQREGLFLISDVLGPLTYRLKLPSNWWIHNVFHAVLLQPYVENEIHGANFPRPPPELLEGEEVYEVESIIKHRRRSRGYQFLLKWKGYPLTDATWESELAFSDDGNMLAAYKDQHQLWQKSRLHKNKTIQCLTHILITCFHSRSTKNGSTPIGRVSSNASKDSRMNASIWSQPTLPPTSTTITYWIGYPTTVSSRQTISDTSFWI